MDFEKFTERSQGFIQAAQMIAVGKRHQMLQLDHLLKALLDDREGMAAGLIRAAGGDPQKALHAVEANLEKIPQVYAQGSADQLHLAPEFVRFVSTADEIARKSGDSYITVERMLLAIALSKDTPAQKALAGAGVTAEAINGAINAAHGGRKADSPQAEIRLRRA